MNKRSLNIKILSGKKTETKTMIKAMLCILHTFSKVIIYAIE